MTSCTMIGIGELAAGKQPGLELRTMALGSCIAIIMLDPVQKAVGMVHIALPDSSIDRLKAMSQPGYFADTGIPSLLMKMAEHGCDSRGKGFIIKLIGGANTLDAAGVFNIGKRNLLSVRKILYQMKLTAVAEDVGGEISRTVRVFQDTGKIHINSPRLGTWEI